MKQIEIIDAPELVQRITAGVDPEWYDPADLRFAPQLGFVALSEAGHTYALGFCATPGENEGDPLPWIRPITTLSGVPESQRTIDRQGKGVGPRLYSTCPATVGVADPTPPALYALQISPDVKIADIRGKRDNDLVGMTGRIARHAGRIIRSRLTGLESVVDEIHSSYEGADIVLLNQPPNARRRQIARGVPSVKGVDPTLFIVRDPSLYLRRVGRLGVGATAT